MAKRKKSSNDEERYVLTFKGLLSVKFSEQTTQELTDHLELYMRRNNYNAIILDDEYGGFLFSEVEITEEK